MGLYLEFDDYLDLIVLNTYIAETYGTGRHSSGRQNKVNISTVPKTSVT